MVIDLPGEPITAELTDEAEGGESQLLRASSSRSLLLAQSAASNNRSNVSKT